jgi:hypothetical protein
VLKRNEIEFAEALSTGYRRLATEIAKRFLYFKKLLTFRRSTKFFFRGYEKHQADDLAVLTEKKSEKRIPSDMM